MSKAELELRNEIARLRGERDEARRALESVQNLTRTAPALLREGDPNPLAFDRGWTACRFETDALIRAALDKVGK